MTQKRPREEKGRPEEWQSAVAWIQKEGGKIHPSLVLSEDRQLVAQAKINQNDQIFCIPKSCLVSLSAVEKDEKNEFGQELIKIFQFLDTTTQLYNSKEDLLIALFLAQEPDKTKFQPYLKTLPETTSFDALPRRWTPEQLELLKGCRLLDKIQEQKEGIQNDYTLIRKAWQEGRYYNSDDGNKQEEASHAFPPFQVFSDRLAAISSRAFAGFGDSTSTSGEDTDVALVPLLDLCNHVRGGNHATLKNVSYQKLRNGSGAVQVTAIQTIEPGNTLCITYGAQGNAQLLLNYGFCIPNNLEPDGSSNDFLDFVPHDSGEDNTTQQQKQQEVIRLRAGPKAHSFHGFINALDAYRRECLDHTMIQKKCGDLSRNNNDFEENEQAFAEWEVDMTMNMDEIEGEEDDDDDEEDDDEEQMQKQKEDTIQSYLEALSKFRKRLLEVLEGYSLSSDQLDEVISNKAAQNSARYFAALLIKSEHRTIYFMLAAINKVEELLGSPKHATQSAPIPSHIKLSDTDITKINRQVEGLATAFIKLRVPEVDPS